MNAEAQRISREADQANAIAAECQAGLDKALPALAAAEEALNVLTKKDMSELKVSFCLAALRCPAPCWQYLNWPPLNLVHFCT